MPSVTIGGVPIAFDFECKVRNFLRDRLPADEVLFSRWMPEPKAHAAVVDNYEAFTPPYPPLPAIEVGELQWPSGASRYGRALYLVDRDSLLAIARMAWGYLGKTITDYLPNWGSGIAVPGGVSSLLVRIQGEEEFAAQMLPLPPYRVPGFGADLWLLPLVDRRFLWQQFAYDPDGTPSDWDALFSELANTLGVFISSGNIDSDYGVPDSLTIKPGVQATALLDCAALSIGRRIILDPLSANLRMLTAAESDVRCESTMAKPTRIAGAFRGKAVLPKELAVYCRKASEFSLACNLQEVHTATVGAGVYTQLAHSAWTLDYRLSGGSMQTVNSLDTGYYVEKVADDLATWLDSGGQYAFAGAIKYLPSGYDDYLTIKTAETEPGEYWFASRVYELPPVFLPNLLLSQSPNLKVASIVEQFTAKDQTTNPGQAHFPGNPAEAVAIAGLTGTDSGQTVTAFYRCGVGWTKIAATGTSGAVELVVFTLTADLAATQGATATANATNANTIGGATTAVTVTNPGRFRAFSGAEGIAAKLSASLYWILEVDQPALRVLVELDAHPDSSGGAVRYGADPRESDAAFKLASPAPQVLTPFPFSFLPDSVNPFVSTGLIPNPRKLFGEDGDMAVLAWDPSTDTYFLEEVFPQRQQLVWAQIATARPAGLNQVISCTPEAPASDGSFPASPFNVTDVFNVAINGRATHKILAHWNADTQQYQAIASQHTARRVKCTVFASFSGAPATFRVTPVAGMDGATPSGALLDVDGCITIQNRYGWDAGTVGDPVEVLWDTFANQWYPEQMKCQT